MRKLRTVILSASAIMALCSIVSAQGRRASIDAANKWRETAVAKAGSSNISLETIGVAAQRTDAGIDVNIAVTASPNFSSFGPVTYSVQAVAVTGNQTLRLGKPVQVTSSIIERMAADANGIVATPQITMLDLAQANAVEVTVKGLTENGAPVITVPLGSDIKTAALGWIDNTKELR
jgi:hypothetical protein